MPLPNGKMLKKGRYAIHKLIANGGMSEIYEAGDYYGYLATIKKLVPHNIASQEDKEDAERMFQKEIQLLNQLNSKIFPKYIDDFEENNEKYLVMEYIWGRNFDDIVKKHGKLSEERVKEIALTLLSATGELHKLHHIHRDITPDNIMEDSAGQIRLIDLGVVHPMPSSKNGTQVIQEIWGKPAFVAPEQWSGHADERSDLYAIGRVMQFLLTGKDYRPFEIDLILEKNISSQLANFLIKAMSCDPKDRFQTAEQMAKVLKGIKIKKPRPQKQVINTGANPAPIKIWNGIKCSPSITNVGLLKVFSDYLRRCIVVYLSFYFTLLIVNNLLNYFNVSLAFVAPLIICEIFEQLLEMALIFYILSVIVVSIKQYCGCGMCLFLNIISIPIKLLRLLWQKIKTLQVGSKIIGFFQKAGGAAKSIDWKWIKRRIYKLAIIGSIILFLYSCVTPTSKVPWLKAFFYYIRYPVNDGVIIKDIFTLMLALIVILAPFVALFLLLIHIKKLVKYFWQWFWQN